MVRIKPTQLRKPPSLGAFVRFSAQRAAHTIEKEKFIWNATSVEAVDGEFVRTLPDYPNRFPQTQDRNTPKSTNEVVPT